MSAPLPLAPEDLITQGTTLGTTLAPEDAQGTTLAPEYDEELIEIPDDTIPRCGWCGHKLADTRVFLIPHTDLTIALPYCNKCNRHLGCVLLPPLPQQRPLVQIAHPVAPVAPHQIVSIN